MDASTAAAMDANTDDDNVRMTPPQMGNSPVSGQTVQPGMTQEQLQLMGMQFMQWLQQMGPMMPQFMSQTSQYQPQQTGVPQGMMVPTTPHQPQPPGSISATTSPGQEQHLMQRAMSLPIRPGTMGMRTPQSHGEEQHIPMKREDTSLSEPSGMIGPTTPQHQQLPQNDEDSTEEIYEMPPESTASTNAEMSENPNSDIQQTAEYTPEAGSQSIKETSERKTDRETCALSQPLKSYHTGLQGRMDSTLSQEELAATEKQVNVHHN